MRSDNSRRRKRRHGRLFLCVSLVVSLWATPAFAGQIRGDEWGDDGIVLYEGCCYSNAVGMWQAIIATTGCGMYIDGYFGSATTEGTGGVQQNIAGVTVDYVVGSATWHGTEWSQYSGGYRLNGPFGDDYWGFYGGTANTLVLWWDGTSWGEWDWMMPFYTDVWYNSETTQMHISAYQFC